MSSLHRRYCPISLTGLVFGSIAVVVGVGLSNEQVSALGFLFVLVAATALVTVRNSINAEIVEYARQTGYDDGFQDGLAVERPNAATPLRIVG